MHNFVDNLFVVHMIMHTLLISVGNMWIRYGLNGQIRDPARRPAVVVIHNLRWIMGIAIREYVHIPLIGLFKLYQRRTEVQVIYIPE